MNKHPIQQEVERFIEELYALKSRKIVMQARTNGESLESIAEKLNVTRERVRQIEAKYTRRFALWCGKTNIIKKIISDSNSSLSNNLLKEYFGNYYPEMIYLLCLYKNRYYSGSQLDYLDFSEIQIDNIGI